MEISQMFAGRLRGSKHMGVMDCGRNYFSQAVQMIAICSAVDLSNLDSLEKRRIFERVQTSIQTALDAVIVKKSEGGDSQDTKRAKLAEAVEALVANAEVLGLNAKEIKETVGTAKGKDDKTAKAWLPITRTLQIKENEPSGDPIKMTLVVGMAGLTTEAHDNIHTGNGCCIAWSDSALS
ncbi:hypothetical protein FIBSPDRAFT_211766 [Athelia psychrophila]|uniref:Uncharacterized protein n=1 Tax=Athelia psychrophila TaxID=1759441 RepID=A0A166WTT6_9AGAM|nr:hypothetical protein FIBSPDRAFT_211766 [Fibularhizoctonia sp. CBS 109695]